MKESKKHKGRRILIGILIGLVLFFCGVHCYFFIPVMDYMKNSEGTFTIPDTNHGFIAQGISFDSESGEIYLTGYMKDGSASPIYIVDSESGECTKKILMAKNDGSAFNGHCGGIAYLDGKIYIAGSSDYCVYEFDAKAIRNAENGASVAYTQALALDKGDNIKVAYLTVHNGLLYAGEFYRDSNYITDSKHYVETSTGTCHSYLVGFKVGDDGLEPVEVYSTPDQIQGAVFSDKNIYLSSSYGVAFSKVYQYALDNLKPDGKCTVQGKEVPHYMLGDEAGAIYKLPPMAEEMELIDGKIYTMCESASNKYIFGKLLGAWKVYAADLKGFFEE